MSGVLLRLRTRDGVQLIGRHLPGPGDTAVVIGHGFTNGSDKPGSLLVSARLAGRHPVYALDFRGHGRSGGVSSVGRDEYLDLDAAVAHARRQGHARVAVVGFSMGAAVALQHAVLGEHRPDAVVAVSAPSRWYIRQTVPMRRVHWLLEHPAGRLAGRALRVRLGPQWTQVPPTPLELVHRIAPIPLLLVHGTADRYFSPMHATALHAAAGHGELWIEPGMGHAESGSTPELLDRISAWIGESGPGGGSGPAQSSGCASG